MGSGCFWLQSLFIPPRPSNLCVGWFRYSLHPSYGTGKYMGKATGGSWRTGTTGKATRSNEVCRQIGTYPRTRTPQD